MKIRLSQLRRIIKEEVSRVLEADSWEPYPGTTGYRPTQTLRGPNPIESAAAKAAQSVYEEDGQTLEQKIKSHIEEYNLTDPSIGLDRVRKSYSENLPKDNNREALRVYDKLLKDLGFYEALRVRAATRY